MKFAIDILIERKEGVADPEGNTIKDALRRLGYDSVESVRTSKMFSVVVEVNSPAEAKQIAEEIAQKVLANPVIENFKIFNIEEAG